MYRWLFLTLVLSCFVSDTLSKPLDKIAWQNPVDSSTRIEKEFVLAGQVLALDGSAVEGAKVSVAGKATTTDTQGFFQISVPSGNYKLEVSANNYALENVSVLVNSDTELKVQLQPTIIVTVHPEPEALDPDPSTRIMVKENVLNANPGRPGVPISIPGFPAESPAGGIKAPQYFAPGVAGDHGEPIAQYYQVGDFLLPNNLPANAHGNGYADPNPIISNVIGGVQTDGGAFNVRHGNHAINLT